MNEDRVKTLTEKYFTKQGYKIKKEVGISGTNREVVLDYYAYKNGNPPQIVWIECKGDTNLSMLLEGFIRLELGIHYGGGLGIFAVPHNSTLRMLEHQAFLQQANGTIALLDVEKQSLHRL